MVNIILNSPLKRRNKSQFFMAQWELAKLKYLVLSNGVFMGRRNMMKEPLPTKCSVNSLAREQAKDSGKEVKTEVKVVFEHDDKIYHAVRKFSCFGKDVEEKKWFCLTSIRAKWRF